MYHKRVRNWLSPMQNGKEFIEMHTVSRLSVDAVTLTGARVEHALNSCQWNVLVYFGETTCIYFVR